MWLLDYAADLQIIVDGVRERRRPAPKGVGQGDAIHLNLGPFHLRDDLVGDAGRAEHGRHLAEGRPQVRAHAVDVVPLVWRSGNRNVVRVQLEPIKLPLENEKGS